MAHELAHAWEHEHLTDDLRGAFLGHWGLDNWNDHSRDWGERGTEKAAHTIAYAVILDTPTDNPNILQFVCGYELLTGNPLPDPHLAE